MKLLTADDAYNLTRDILADEILRLSTTYGFQNVHDQAVIVASAALAVALAARNCESSRK